VNVFVVDPILDMRYFETLLPRMAQEPVAELFYETKANLTRAQVRQLAEAGIRWIKPGIESFSDRSLALMRKGTTERVVARPTPSAPPTGCASKPAEDARSRPQPSPRSCALSCTAASA